MLNFNFQNPTHIYFGEGQIQAVAQEIPLNSRILMVYGGGSIKSNGVYQQVIDALSDHTWFEFSGIEPNPTYNTLMKAQDVIKAEKIDYILAVGGGSVVDGAKFIAAAALFKVMKMAVQMTVQIAMTHGIFWLNKRPSLKPYQ